MKLPAICIEGIGVWSPQVDGYAALCGMLSGRPVLVPAALPAATILPPAERRRAPASVRLAVEVAHQAVAMSGRDAATLPCVFASSHGDQATTDHLCATLAHEPMAVSPTRFHNSVHNAAAGYWTIAVGSHAASTAVAAGRASFGAGLLEAASLAWCQAQPVLLACSDTAGVGPMGEVTGSREPFGCAMVLVPERTPHTLARLELQLTAPQVEAPLPEPLETWRAGNPSAPALALLAALAQGARQCQLAASPTLGLRIGLERTP